MHGACANYAKCIDDAYAICIVVAMARVNITELRARLGNISQEALGKKAGGVSQSTISRLESAEQPVEVDGPLGVVLAQLDREAGRESSAA
jgi:DNA-binding XRE family transcriptional regulator